MRTLNFTPEQKEKILDAVDQLYFEQLSFYYYANAFSKLTSSNLMNLINDVPAGGVADIKADHLESIILDNDAMQSFFYELQKAITNK
jgi:hypothetical protein